jgi:hypothetical protein
MSVIFLALPCPFMVGNNKRQSIISIGTHLEMTINNFEVNVKEPTSQVTKMNKNIEVNLIIMIFRENVLLLPATGTNCLS